MIKINRNFFKPKLDKVLFLLIIIISVALRLYNISSPLSDWHGWRQADTASVARNFAEDGFDLLRPKYHDISNIASGLYNEKGYRMVEFPLYNAGMAFMYKLYPAINIEIYGRVISIISSLLIIYSIYYLMLKEYGKIASFFSSIIFAIMPFFVFYSRVVLPDMTAVSMCFLSILTFYIYCKTPNTKRFKIMLLFTLSCFLFAVAVLIKPTVIFYSIAFIYLFIKRHDFKSPTKWYIYIFAGLAILPFILWRIWIQNFPEGIPVNEWLFFSTNTSQGLTAISFTPAFFRWVFVERLANIILGVYLITFFVVGILIKQKSYFLYSLLLSCLLYIFTFQGGNVQHDYYQIIILPTVAMITGYGISFFYNKNKFMIHPIFSSIIISLCIAISFLYSYFTVKDYYKANNELVSIAKIISTITEPDSIIVTDTTGDTSLMYLSNRKGYPAVVDDLRVLKKRGADYFVTNKPDIAAKQKSIFTPIFESEKIFIFKL